MNITTWDRKLAVVQATSGLAFSTFSLLHLGGHLLASVRFSLADTALYASREYYQNGIVEPLVVGVALVAHMGASFTRMYLRSYRKRQTKASKPAQVSTKEEKAEKVAAAAKTTVRPTQSVALRELEWHRYSAYVLALSIGGHVLATRITPLKVLPDTSIIDLSWITNTLVEYPFLFPPYYFALGTAGVYHTLYGIQQSLSVLGWISPARRAKPGAWTKVMGVSAVLMASALAAIAGFYEQIPMPLKAKWDELDRAIIDVALGRI